MNLKLALLLLLPVPAGAASTGTIASQPETPPGMITIYGNTAVIDQAAGVPAGLKSQSVKTRKKAAKKEKKATVIPKLKPVTGYLLGRAPLNTLAPVKNLDPGGCPEPCPCGWAVGQVLGIIDANGLLPVPAARTVPASRPAAGPWKGLRTLPGKKRD